MPAQNRHRTQNGSIALHGIESRHAVRTDAQSTRRTRASIPTYVHAVSMRYKAVNNHSHDYPSLMYPVPAFHAGRAVAVFDLSHEVGMGVRQVLDCSGKASGIPVTWTNDSCSSPNHWTISSNHDSSLRLQGHASCLESR